MKTPDILSALTPVTEAFEQLSIPHYIGSKFALWDGSILSCKVAFDLINSTK